jgi:hypothetical protein
MQSTVQQSWMMKVTTAMMTIFKSPDGLTFAARAAIATTDCVARQIGIGCIGGVSPKTIQTLETFYDVATVVRLPNNINYFTRGLSRAEWREGGVKYIASWCASLLFLAARVTSVTIWLQKYELMSLAGIAKACGNIPIFGQVVRFGLARMCNTLLLGAMSCVVIKHAWALYWNQANDVQYAKWDLVNNLSDIVFTVMTFSGVISVWALALTVCVVAPTGIAATLLLPQEPIPSDPPVIPSSTNRRGG